jgi:hypothetical protein
VRGLIPIFGPLLRARLGPDRVRLWAVGYQNKWSQVAAPVRSAAPVRRHQSHMSGLGHPEAVGDLRREHFLSGE